MRAYGEEDAGPMRSFGEARATRYLCQLPAAGPDSFECRACGLPAPTARPSLVALTEAGEIVAAAWLDRDEAGARAALAVQSPYTHDGITPRMLRQLGQEAAARGVARVNTCVFAEGAMLLSQFRDAGLEIESSFNAGGVTEVVLRTGAQ